MTKKDLLGFSLVLVGLTSLSTAAWLGFAGSSMRESPLANWLALEARIAPVSYMLPNYTGFNSTDVCSGQNIQNPDEQRASWNCAGSFGQCILCRPLTNAPVSLSGLKNQQGSGSVQPTDGANQTCSNYEQWTGTCVRSNSGYLCSPGSDLQATCQGSYLDYDYQIMSGKPIIIDPDTGRGRLDELARGDVIVVR